MQVEKVSEYKGFQTIKGDWESFLEQCEWSCLSMTHDWLSSWWEAFGGSANLWVLLLRRNGEIRGFFPLMLKRGRFRGLPAKMLTLMVNGHSPDGNIVLGEPLDASVTCILEFLNCCRREWDVLYLERLSRKRELTDQFDQWLKENHISHIITGSLTSPYIDMSGDWETYYASRSKKFRKVMRNKLNRIEKEGGISIQRVSDEREITNNLPEAFEVSARSWKARVRRAIPDDPRVERFYRRLTATLGKKGAVDLWLMRYKGKAIAFEYHVKHQGVSHPIRADFDEDYQNLSPGSVLEYQIIKSLFRNPSIRKYNSCGNTYEYLMNWATGVIEHVDIQVFNSKTYSRNLFFLESKILPVAKEAKVILRP